jgi:hypothetical protein
VDAITRVSSFMEYKIMDSALPIKVTRHYQGGFCHGHDGQGECTGSMAVIIWLKNNRWVMLCDDCYAKVITPIP